MAPSHLIPHNPELSTSLSVFFFHDSFTLPLLWQMPVDGGDFINLKAFAVERSRSPLHPITLSSITTILNYDKCFLAQLRDKSGEGKVFVCCSFVFVFPSVMFSALPPATETNKTNSRSIL
jgi:predicted permease